MAEINLGPLKNNILKNQVNQISYAIWNGDASAKNLLTILKVWMFARANGHRY